jgi:hypothetical protein
MVWFRTDLGEWYYYDGTRWLSATLYEYPIGTLIAQPFAATVSPGHAAVVPDLAGGSDLWLVGLQTAFDVGAGTALNGSNNWIGVFYKAWAASSSALITVTINSGANATWLTNYQAIGAVLNGGTTGVLFKTAWAKTGTPGNLYVLHTLHYRIVAT